jgi:hypothetical protein
MSMDAELRRALKPVDPGPEFTARVLAAAAADRARLGEASVDEPLVEGAASRGGADRTAVRRAPGWVWAALAASLVGAIVGARWVEDRREVARAQQARAELIQALRLTGAKLHVARDAMAERAGSPR